MKVSCLVHVLNLAARALLVGLDVTNSDDEEDDLLVLDETSLELMPSIATTDVAPTVLKVIKVHLFSLCLR
jgi:hypothetical protein